MWRGTIRVLALIGAGLLSFSASAFDDPAPFGFSWGPLDRVPTPSLATRHDDVTLLIYRRDRLPSEELRDTEEIVLQICKEEGLQQVVWISIFPILRSAISLIRYSRRASVDTEKPNLESEELFAGTAVKLLSPPSQMIKASTAYSWRATGLGLMLARRSTGIQ